MTRQVPGISDLGSGGPAMSLGWKIVLLLTIVFSLYLETNYFVQQLVLAPSFEALERDEAIDDINRCRSALRNEVRHLSVFCRDWSASEDTCNFVQTGDRWHLDQNMMVTAFSGNQLNLVSVCDLSGRVLWQQGYDLASMHPLRLEAFASGALPTDSPLLRHSRPDSVVEGILLTERGAMMVCSRPIVSSNNLGPIRGSMIMGRLLTEAKVRELAAQTRVALTITPATDPDPFASGIIQQLTGRTEAIIPARTEQSLTVCVLEPAISGGPGVLLRAEIPRLISARGRGVMRFAMFSDVIAAGAILLLTWATLQKMVVRRIASLTEHAVRVGSRDDLESRFPARGRDEIATLGNEFNHMVQRLAESRRSLLASAHRAGMAEIAAAVLHNIGNALNSVGVSADLLGESISDNKLEDLRQAIELLKSTRSPDLPADRTAAVVAYVDRLSEVLLEQRQQMNGVLQSLQQSIHQIEQTIRAQQRSAAAPESCEVIALDQLVSECVGNCQERLRQHGIRVVQQTSGLPPVSASRHKLRLVLENLIHNALDAIRDTGAGTGVITVRAGREGEQLYLEIADTGPGIPQDLRQRVFQNGFTTKGEGHGAGLHFCANALGSMGGRIAVMDSTSGATVRITLPLAQEEQPV